MKSALELGTGGVGSVIGQRLHTYDCFGEVYLGDMDTQFAEALAAGALLVFVPAIAMYAITTLMGGGSNPTFGEVIQNQFTKARNQPFGAALGVLLMLLFLVSFLVLGRKKNAAHAA